MTRTKYCLLLLVPLVLAFTDPLFGENYPQGSKPGIGGKITDRAQRGRMGSSDADMELHAIRSVLRDMVIAVTDGDFEDFVDHLEARDRRRIGKTELRAQILPLSENFNMRWRRLFAINFDEGLNQINLPVEIKESDDDEGRATVRVGQGESDKVEMKMVRGGMLGTGWRVDIDDSLNAKNLQSALREAMEQVEAQDISGSMEAAYYRVACRLLGPVGKKAITEARAGHSA